MRANLGSVDRLLRLAVGLIAVAGLFFGSLAASSGSGLPQFLLAGAAAILIGTSAMKFCPAYKLFGIRTCKTE